MEGPMTPPRMTLWPELRRNILDAIRNAGVNRDVAEQAVAAWERNAPPPTCIVHGRHNSLCRTCVRRGIFTMLDTFQKVIAPVL